MQIMHNSNFSGTEGWRRLTKRYSPTTPVRGLQLMMSVVSPQKITKGNQVLEMIERWETKILALERDFNERLSERMKAGVLLNMMPEDLQNSFIQQADNLENFKMAKEKVLSIMEAKNALHPDAMDTDNVNYESYDNTDEDDGDEEDLGAVHRDSLCNRCGGKVHFARNCGTPDPRGNGKVKGKVKDGKGGSQQQAKGVPGTPSFASTATRKDTLRRSAGRRNVRRTVTGQRTMLTRTLATWTAWDLTRRVLKLRRRSHHGHRIPLQPSPRSQRGACFIAANGTWMENLGQKRVDFEAANGVKSNIIVPSYGFKETTSVCVQDSGQGQQGRVRA